MPLPRTEVVPGFLDEIDRFEELVRPLAPEAWEASTRCTGWRVADVAAHVTGGLTDVAALRLDGFGDPTYVDRVVAERRGRSSAEVADELHEARAALAVGLGGLDDQAWEGPAATPVTPTVGDGVVALWYDAYIHAQDIRDALGQPAERGPGLPVALSHLADLLDQQGWGPATLAADGLGKFPVGAGGPEVKGDALELVLAGTGRADPGPLGLDETVNVYR